MFEVFLSSQFLIYSIYVIYIIEKLLRKWDQSHGIFVMPVCNAKLL